jgi:hypothetical protein
MIVQGIADTNQPNPHISTANSWVPTIARTSGMAGQGGQKSEPRAYFQYYGPGGSSAKFRITNDRHGMAK